MDSLNKPGEVPVYDSWDAMQAHVPESFFEKAQLAAGIRQPVTYPEEGLEV